MSFYSPEDTRFEEMLFKNGEEKCKAVFEKLEVTNIMADELIHVLFFKNPEKLRLITKQITSIYRRR